MFYGGGAVSTMLATEYDLGDGRVRSHVRRVDGRLSDTIRYYDAHAAAYAATTMAIDTSVQLDRFGSLLPPNAKVLDAGCGSGRDLARLARLGFHPVGLDLSAGLAAIARQTSGCEVMVGDLRELHMSDCSFEGVWAMASLLHLARDELPDVLSSLANSLKPGGILFASVKRGAGEVEDDTGRSFTLYNEAEWAERLRDAGLDVIEVVGEPADPDPRPGTVAPGWISSLARRR